MSGERPEELSEVGVASDLLDDETLLDVQTVRDGPTERVTVFELGGRRYGFDVEAVDQVVESPPMTRVPRTAPIVDGVVDVRGDITVVLNPLVHLDPPDPPRDWPDQSVLVLRTAPDEQPAGVRIDRVVGVERFPADDVDHDDAGDVPDADSRLVSGVARRLRDGEIQDRVTLLSVPALVDAAGRHPHRSREG